MIIFKKKCQTFLIGAIHFFRIEPKLLYEYLNCASELGSFFFIEMQHGRIYILFRHMDLLVLFCR